MTPEEELVPVCRECGKPCPDTLYCSECAEVVKCPHGNKLGECDTCDYEGDLAFDASRER